jgi:predicted GNAT superfamily acetyltransferase
MSLTERARPGGRSTPDARPVQPAIVVRPLTSHEDLLACVQLQKETWGENFTECVPPSILNVSQRIGGVTAGAFDANHALVGFVFGMTGVQDGRLVHWSDMLAVRGRTRNMGIGRRLKEFQRDALLPLGVEVIYWTFDPLVARNAYLNLHHLGAEVVEYVVDMYGQSESTLHRGMGTDRFVVAWSIVDGHPSRASRPLADGIAPEPDAPVDPEAPHVRIEIPVDIQAVQNESLAEAARWRSTTREAFLHYLQRGYKVVGFERNRDSGRRFYLLSHP